MPVVLTSDERKRLAKLAGMLGPNSDGERLNALSFIQKLADQKKVAAAIARILEKRRKRNAA